MKWIHKPYIPAILLVTLFLGFTALTYQDYGITVDEWVQHAMGTEAYNYITKNDTTYLRSTNRDYGISYELVLSHIEKKKAITDFRDIYLMRHLVTHLSFLIAAICGYILFYRLFRNNFIAAAGFLMLVCMPRIYAHSYFNTKDIPLLSAFIVSFMAAQIAFSRNSIIWYCILGLFCGVTVSIRPTGSIIPAMVSLFFIFDVIHAVRARRGTLRTIAAFVLFIAFFCSSLYVCWPYLWGHPVDNFLHAFNTFSHFNRWQGQVLFLGTRYPGEALPWFYVPGYFAFTVPELWLALGIAGIIWLAVLFAKKPLSFLLNTDRRQFLMYGACFFAPLLAVIVFHSVLYDDWRHLYFIYPSFVLLALFALDSFRKVSAKWLMPALFAVQFTFVAFFMIYYHPYQQVYFNYLVSHEKEYLRKNFELDYWGASYKQAIDHIAAHETTSPIRLGVYDQVAVRMNNEFLPADQRTRLYVVSRFDYPYYYITNFRDPGIDECCPEYYTIKVLNSTIVGVYKCDARPMAADTAANMPDRAKK